MPLPAAAVPTADHLQEQLAAPSHHPSTAPADHLLLLWVLLLLPAALLAARVPGVCGKPCAVLGHWLPGAAAPEIACKAGQAESEAVTSEFARSSAGADQFSNERSCLVKLSLCVPKTRQGP
jgi:hypothetical protein